MTVAGAVLVIVSTTLTAAAHGTGGSVFSQPRFFITYALLQVLGFLMLIRFLDPFERPPFGPLAVMAAWGATGAAALAAAGNGPVGTLLPLPPDASHRLREVLAAPFVEEFAKGIALVVVFLGSRALTRVIRTQAIEGVNRGIIFGAAVGIGFAFTENVFFLISAIDTTGDVPAALQHFFFDRTGIFGTASLGHAIYTGMFGAALGLATWMSTRALRIAVIAAGACLAALLHFLYNGLLPLALAGRHGWGATSDLYGGCLTGGVCSDRDLGLLASGANVIPRVVELVSAVLVVGAFWAWIVYQRNVIREELTASAEAGLLGVKEVEVLTRYWRRTRWYWHVIRRAGIERYRVLRMLHGLLVDLALTKRRLRRTRRPDLWNERIGQLWSQIDALRRAAASG